jgi:hypothetical protein
MSTASARTCASDASKDELRAQIVALKDHIVWQDGKLDFTEKKCERYRGQRNAEREELDRQIVLTETALHQSQDANVNLVKVKRERARLTVEAQSKFEAREGERETERAERAHFFLVCGSVCFPCATQATITLFRTSSAWRGST